MTGPHRRGRSVVLLSGGMDSATCLALARRGGGEVHALTVLYGQRHRREVAAARALARAFGVRHHAVVRVPTGALLRSSLTDANARLPEGGTRSGRIPSTYVPARNTLLLALALGYAESYRLDAIVLGANAIDYSGYPDCRPAFLRAFERVARLGTKRGVTGRGGIRVVAPLLTLSKRAIVDEGERLGVPWRLTWSCYRGGATPCGRCDACRLRARGFRAAGVADPLLARRGRSGPVRAAGSRYRTRIGAPSR